MRIGIKRKDAKTQRRKTDFEQEGTETRIYTNDTNFLAAAELRSVLG